MFAPWDGRVDYDYDDIYGCKVWLRSAERGDLLLAHVSKRVAAKRVRVQRGTLLALSGGRRGTSCAGNSTGPHVHVGWWNGRWKDPTKLCEAIFTPEEEPEMTMSEEAQEYWEKAYQELKRIGPDADPTTLDTSPAALRILIQIKRKLEKAFE